MAALPNMPDLLGKTIADFCRNGFHDAAANHCAHFVSHVAGLTFSYHCRQFVGGTKEPANIRVHEIFAQCPKVGRWDEADQTRPQLVFVTRKDVVDLATKTMQNIPQKHIGIYQDGHVYHYANGKDEVVRQTPADFLKTFQKAYAGDQGLFFGDFPFSNLMLSVEAAGTGVPHYGFALCKAGAKWYARRTDLAGAPEFLAGVEVNQPAKKYHGLYLPAGSAYGPTYDPAQYVPTIDHWAYLLDVTAAGESNGSMNVVNTYDRAHFTFGFYQLAAHTPRDNLILFFRMALLHEEFQGLFPDLRLKAGKVFRVGKDGTETDLEAETYDPATGEHQLRAFMTYLNPERLVVDEQEVLQAARMVWWANESQIGREVQVRVSNAILQRKMSERYSAWYGLDGQPDTVCAAIADIHHQGRGKKAEVRAALKEKDPLLALTKIGEGKYPERCKTLRARLRKWVDAGEMGTKRYDAGLNQFA